MNISPEVPPHISLAHEKLEWDEKQREINNSRTNMIITDIDIPFFRLVAILVKFAIAAVPAGIIVAIFWMIIAALFVGGSMR